MAANISLEQTAWTFCRQQAMFSPGCCVLVALSGGADSVSLLQFLHHKQNDLQISALAACHVHHGLRGLEADRDAAFCADLCQTLQVAFFSAACDVKSQQLLTGETLEETARRLRYDLLVQNARTLEQQTGQPCVIALAHTADDQTETVLQHLVRGCGLSGLCGMAPCRNEQGVLVVRPFLCCTRRQVENYLSEHHLAHVEDSTNQTDFCFRNRLRHQVVPPLKKENPALAQNLAKQTLLWQMDEGYLAQQAQQAYTHALMPERCNQNTRVLRLDRVCSLHPAMQNRVLLLLLAACGCERSRQNCESLLKLVAGERRRFDPDRIHCFQTTGGLLYGCASASNKTAEYPTTDAPTQKSRSEKEWCLNGADTLKDLPVQGAFCRGENTYCWKIEVLFPVGNKTEIIPGQVQKKIMESSKNHLFLALDYDRIVRTLRTVHRPTGDHPGVAVDASAESNTVGGTKVSKALFVPYGMTGSKSLKKLLSGWHLSQMEKQNALILADDEGIAGVMAGPGCTVAARLAVTEKTRRVLWIKRVQQRICDAADADHLSMASAGQEGVFSHV